MDIKTYTHTVRIVSSIDEAAPMTATMVDTIRKQVRETTRKMEDQLFAQGIGVDGFLAPPATARCKKCSTNMPGSFCDYCQDSGLAVMPLGELG